MAALVGRTMIAVMLYLGLWLAALQHTSNSGTPVRQRVAAGICAPGLNALFSCAATTRPAPSLTIRMPHPRTAPLLRRVTASSPPRDIERRVLRQPRSHRGRTNYVTPSRTIYAGGSPCAPSACVDYPGRLRPRACARP